MSTHAVIPPGEDSSSISFVSLSLVLGHATDPDSTRVLDRDAISKCELQIEPGKPAVVGRCDSQEVPYLDVGLKPTTLVPGSGQTVLVSGGQGKDHFVSRAHFMLRCVVGGVLLINGVPDRNGKIRPPKNGTRLLAPIEREFEPAEAYLIEPEVETIVLLPNGLALRIDARPGR